MIKRLSENKESKQVTAKAYSSFELKIDNFDNAGMSDPSEATIGILKKVIKLIESGRDGGKCMDANGNSVGSWDFNY